MSRSEITEILRGNRSDCTFDEFRTPSGEPLKMDTNHQPAANGGIIGRLAWRIAHNECLFCGWAGINDPAIVEHLARENFDAIVMDMQHGAFDVTGVIRSIGVVALFGKPSIVRIPVGEFSVASKVIDAGAAAVIAPMINTVDDAKRFVDHMKYPPLGQRSWGPRAALLHSSCNDAAYLQDANRITLAIAMIETEDALQSLDGILAVPGIDGVFVGPSDLCIALHKGRIVDPLDSDVDSALDQIVCRAKLSDKFAAVYCGDGKRARALQHRGFRICAISSDAMMMRSAARAELEAARG